MAVQILPEALTTLSNLKGALTISDTSRDDVLTQIINRVTNWIEGNTNRLMVARNYNGKGTIYLNTKVTSQDYFYIDGYSCSIDDDGRGRLDLPAYPIQRDSNAVTLQLAVLTNRDSGGETWDTTQLAEWTDFIIDNDRGILRLTGGVFTPGYRNYRLQCTAGFYFTQNAPYVPDDLEGLCIELCKLMVQDSRNVQSEHIGSWSRSYRPVVDDPYLMDIFAKYSRPVL